MYLGINRQVRRDLLKMVLHNFIATPPQRADEAARCRFNELAHEAKMLLDEIAASERLAANPITSDNGASP